MPYDPSMQRRAAALTLALLAGCSLLVDESGLSGGETADAGPTPEATTDAEEGDAFTADARAEEAGAVDASPADAGFSCDAEVHDFCDDFDHGALGATWSSATNTGGTLALDPLALSPPWSLLVAVQDGGGPEDLLLHKSFAATAGIHCAFDIRVDAYDSYTDVFHVDFGQASGSYFVRFIMGGTVVNEYGTLPDGGVRVRNNWPTGQPAIGVWTRVDLDLRFSGQAGTAVLAYDGKQVLSVNLSPPTDIVSNKIQLGAWSSAATKWRAHFDNFACDLQR